MTEQNSMRNQCEQFTSFVSEKCNKKLCDSKEWQHYCNFSGTDNHEEACGHPHLFNASLIMPFET